MGVNFQHGFWKPGAGLVCFCGSSGSPAVPAGPEANLRKNRIIPSKTANNNSWGLPAFPPSPASSKKWSQAPQALEARDCTLGGEDQVMA